MVSIHRVHISQLAKLCPLHVTPDVWQKTALSNPCSSRSNGILQVSGICWGSLVQRKSSGTLHNTSIDPCACEALGTHFAHLSNMVMGCSKPARSLSRGSSPDRVSLAIDSIVTQATQHQANIIFNICSCSDDF